MARYALEGLPYEVLGAEYMIALPAEKILTGKIEQAQTQLSGASGEIRRHAERIVNALSPAAASEYSRQWNMTKRQIDDLRAMSKPHGQS